MPLKVKTNYNRIWLLYIRLGNFFEKYNGFTHKADAYKYAVTVIKSYWASFQQEMKNYTGSVTPFVTDYSTGKRITVKFDQNVDNYTQEQLFHLLQWIDSRIQEAYDDKRTPIEIFQIPIDAKFIKPQNKNRLRLPKGN